MSKRESISRYNLIIKKLRKFPATYDEISGYLSMESEFQGYDFNVSKRTFQRDIADIRSLYNIDILYDFSRKTYYINDEDQPEVNERILEAFDTFNALNISDRLSKYIHFDARKPQGTENLYGLLHGIKNRLQINFTYKKFWDEEPGKRTVEPLVLKEFKNRWYVIAKDLFDEKIKSFALDRLTGIHITKRKFIYPKDFDIEKIYTHCFGIIYPDSETPQEIILSFEPVQGKYIKSLPLHRSQQIILDTQDELQITLNLFITFDFIMELLSYGENVKVLKPKSLANEIKTAHNNAVKLYQNE